MPLNSRSRLGHLGRIGVSLLLLVLLLLVSEWITRTWADRLERQRHDYATTRASEMRSRLEGALNSTVFLAQGLVSYVIGVETPTEPQVSRALKAVYESDSRIHSVALSPGNRVTYVYPLEGSEKAIGTRYEDLPQQWPTVQKAIRTRRSVLAGPVNLVQGGTAIIVRTPVFVNGDDYWGIISTFIDLPKLLTDVGLQDTVDGVQYWFFGYNAGVGGDPRIVGLGTEPPSDAMTTAIEVPGGRWRLVFSPVARSDSDLQEILFVRSALYVVSLLLAGFTLVLLNAHATARALAQQFGRLNSSLRTSNRELHHLSRNDPLTSLPNRRSFEESFETAWQICSRSALPLSVMVIDIDHFKSINDAHGHAVGDVTLVAVSAVVKRQLRRGGDIVARFGGEEFIVLAVGLDNAEAQMLAETIRAAVKREVDLPDGMGRDGPVTVSIGFSTLIPTHRHSPRTMLEIADRALYSAKNSGRDQVCCSEQAPDDHAGLKR